MSTWRRFEKWRSDVFGSPVEMEKYVEIVASNNVVCERRGSETREPATSTKDLVSAEAAAEHVRKRVARLLKTGWIEDDPVERDLPKPKKNARKSSKTRASKEWTEAQRDLREWFETRLREEGIQPDATFMGQTRGDEDWNALASKCLRVAEEVYGIEFRRAHFDDVEHMTDGWPLPDDRYAEFYVSPKRVAHIAMRHLRGELTESDGRFPQRRD
jgi:hypothetical protein